MSLGIVTHGIVYRADDGTTTLHKPGRNGGLGTVTEVPEDLADLWRLATGDIVEADTEPIFEETVPEPALISPDEDQEIDEPSAVRGHHVPVWLATHVTPTQRVTAIYSVNGQALSEAEDRPYPRRRSPSERTTPDQALPCTVQPSDVTGRMIDVAATLGLGCAGIIVGPHSAGLTRTLRAVVAGACANSPEVSVIVLLLRGRGEECSDWRRRFPEVDVVVCPSPGDEATAEQTLQMANLVIACAQRQSELGRSVLIAMDSLTALWGTMLEAEAADAQANADRSRARQDIREWVQKAGKFGGEGPLGGSLGGSITLVGTVWQTAVDSEAEEEGEIHPHLRLLEHVVHETSWRIFLSGDLAAQRRFPAIDVLRAISRFEREILGAERHDRLELARRALSSLSPMARHTALLEAIEATQELDDCIDLLVQTYKPARPDMDPRLPYL